MSDEIIAALIALIGVVLSVLVTSAISRRTVRVEIQKLRAKLQEVYATKLLDSRLQTYPDLYSYMSDLVKLAIHRTPSRAELSELRDKVEVWDSKHAVFLGKDTTNICCSFRMALAEALLETSTRSVEPPSGRPEWLRALLGKATALELGLRSDLGIYGFETARDDIESRVAGHY